MTKKEEKEEKEVQKQSDISRLKTFIRAGDTVYTVLTNVSSSGMSRRIKVLISHNNKVIDLSYDVASILGYKNHDDGSVKVSGCGMDMGFHLVYNLSSSLFGKRSNGGGFSCIGDHCPSNDHSNGDRDYTPHDHSNGGYALRHKWL